MKQIHEIQRQILSKLQFADRLHYTQMKPDRDIENNRFDFHLKQLIKLGFLIKSGVFYTLTDTGKRYIANLDTKEKKIGTSALNVVWLLCSKGKKGNRSLLIYTRKKQPFFGCQGFPAGKIKIGETVYESAKRELKEESNLEGEPILKAILHYRSYSKLTKELVQDKFLYLCHFNNPKGELVNSYEGHYEWVREINLFKFLKKPFSTLDDYAYALSLLDSNTKSIQFKECEEYTEVF